ncbi:MAG: putative glycoside hydrolase family 15 protein [Actinobacteria bacterium]|nr:putative glycoside hydrolase family 15 protein [Actinomycetota bacterium]
MRQDADFVLAPPPQETMKPYSKLLPLLVLAAVAATAALVAPPDASSARWRSWFYKPPANKARTATIARTSATVVLTRGDEWFATRLRRAGYRGPLVQHINLLRVQGPAGPTGPLVRSSMACNDTGFSPPGNQIAWQRDDFCDSFHPYEEMFLHNARGERLVDTRTHAGGVTYILNPASWRVRQFFVTRVTQTLLAEQAATPRRYTGIFLDDVWSGLFQAAGHKDNSLGPDGGSCVRFDCAVAEFESNADWKPAVRGFVDEIRAAVTALGFQLWANTGDDPTYASSFHAWMHEGFAASWGAPGYRTYAPPELIRAIWRRVTSDTKAGKRVVLVGQGGRSQVRRMRFALASYLMVANSRVSFRYSDAYTAASYRQFWTYPEYRKVARLGRALGDRRHVRGGTWQRRFKCGLVRVNLKTHVVGISTNRC